MGPLPPEEMMEPQGGMDAAMMGGMPPQMAPPVDPMAGAGMDPAIAEAPTEEGMILQLLQQLLSKWKSGDPSLGGEKADLLQVLMQLAQASPPTAQDAFAEVPGEQQMGMVPTEDVTGEEYGG